MKPSKLKFSNLNHEEMTESYRNLGDVLAVFVNLHKLNIHVLLKCIL